MCGVLGLGVRGSGVFSDEVWGFCRGFRERLRGDDGLFYSKSSFVNFDHFEATFKR